MITQRRFVVICVLACLACLCRLDAAEKDDVRILSISPANNQLLRAGDTFDFEIKIRCNVPAADMRRVRVAISRGREKRSETLAYWNQLVPTGQGVLTVKTTVRIPETDVISVWAGIEEAIPLSIQTQPLASESRSYDVVDQFGKRIKSKSIPDDIIKIVSLSPAAGSSLRIGDTVTFELRADYELKSAETGRAVFGLATRGSVQSVLSTQTILRGKGTLTFNRSIQATAAFGDEPSVFLFLFADGFTRARAGEVQKYRLEQAEQGGGNSAPQVSLDVVGEPEDHVKITARTPSTARSLAGNESAAFEIQVDYELNSLESADLNIRFGGTIWIAQDNRIIRKGRGSFTVERQIYIPKSAVLDFTVRTWLSAPASATDVLAYPTPQ